jgi:hypothetical protein
MAAVQAGRRWGHPWLLGIRRTKSGGAQRSGREGGTGPGSGAVGWAAWAGRQAMARGVGGSARLEKKRKMKSIRN